MASFDEALYRLMLQAVEAQQSPSTGLRERREAFNLLEKFKAREDCGDYALWVLTNPRPEHTDPVRYFALHCLEMLLKVKWESFQDNQKLAFRNSLLSLVASNTRDFASEVLFVKEKIASLLASVAEQEYPERWPDFLDQMLEAWRAGPTQAEVAVTAITAVIQDCVDTDFNSKLSSVRRDAILSQLDGETGKLLDAIYSFLDQQVAFYRAGVAPGADQAAVSRAKAAVTLANRGLTMLRGLIQMDREDVCSSPHNFVMVFVSLLAEAPLRTDALGCIEDLCVQQLPQATFELLMESLPPAMAAVARSLGTAPESDRLAQCQALAACLQRLVVTGHRRVTQDPEFRTVGSAKCAALTRLCEVALAFTEMPSRRVPLECLPLWTLLFKEEGFARCPPIAALGSRLLSAYATRLPRVVWIDADTTEEALASEEFTDKDDYIDFLGSYSGKVLSLIASLGEHVPVHASSAAASTIAGFLSSASAVGQIADPAARDKATQDASNKLTAASQLMERLLAGMPEWSFQSAPPGSPLHTERYTEPPDVDVTKAFAAQQCEANIGGLVRQTFAWQPPNARLASHQLMVMESGKRYLHYHEDVLVPMLGRLFECLVYAEPGHNPALGADLSNEAQAVRRRANQAIISFAKEAADVLARNLPGLCAKVTEMSRAGNVERWQLRQLNESLVLVSNAMDDEAARRSFLGDMLREPVAWFSTPAARTALASPLALLQALGVGAPEGPTNPAVVTRAEAFKEELFNAVGALHDWLRRVRLGTTPTRGPVGKPQSMRAQANAALPAFAQSLDALSASNPLVPTWVAIRDPLLMLVQSLHGVWAPGVRDTLLNDQSARWVLAFPQTAVSNYSSTNKGERVKGQGQPAEYTLDNRPLMASWCTWLSNLRSTAYQLLGLAVQQDVIFPLLGEGAVAGQALSASILSELASQEHRHVEHLLKNVIEPYIIRCPPQLYQSHLVPVLSALMPHMLSRLTNAWQPPPGGEADYTVFQIYVRGGVNLLLEPIEPSVEDVMVMNMRHVLTYAYGELLGLFFGLGRGLITQEETEKEVADDASDGTGRAGRRNKKKGQRGGHGGHGGGRGGGGGSDNGSANGSAFGGSAFGGGGGRGKGKGGQQGRGGGGRGNSHDADSASLEQAARRQRVAGLQQLILHGPDEVVYSAVMFLVASFHWPDTTLLQRTLKIAVRLSDAVWRDGRFSEALGYQMFGQLAMLLAEEPKWLAGYQWDVLVLMRLLYVRLVVGGTPMEIQNNRNQRTPITDAPRKVLLDVIGLPVAVVDELEKRLTKQKDMQSQKDAMRDALRSAVERRQRGGEARDSVAPEDSIMTQRRQNFTNMTRKVQRKSAQLAKRKGNKAAAEAALQQGIGDLFNLDSDL